MLILIECTPLSLAHHFIVILYDLGCCHFTLKINVRRCLESMLKWYGTGIQLIDLAWESLLNIGILIILSCGDFLVGEFLLVLLIILIKIDLIEFFLSVDQCRFDHTPGKLFLFLLTSLDLGQLLSQFVYLLIHCFIIVILWCDHLGVVKVHELLRRGVRNEDLGLNIVIQNGFLILELLS
jgi:hypothetical protein